MERPAPGCGRPHRRRLAPHPGMDRRARGACRGWPRRPGAAGQCSDPDHLHRSQPPPLGCRPRPRVHHATSRHRRCDRHRVGPRRRALELRVSERRAHTRGVADPGRERSLRRGSRRPHHRDPDRAPAIPRGPPRDPLRHRWRSPSASPCTASRCRIPSRRSSAPWPPSSNASAKEPRRQRSPEPVVPDEDRFAAKGTVEPGFETVRDAFAGVLTDQRGTGAALAVWHDQRWIVDLWGGRAIADGTRPWQRDSIVMPYSVSKSFAAMCALVLIDRGLLDLDSPVQRYWPEFTAPATVRHVLSHQAGVVALSAPATTDLFYDWSAVCGLLAAQLPEWTPGTAHGESALFYGHLVGEIVRRIDGRVIGQFLSEEVCLPTGLDFIVGLTPKDQSRAVDLMCFDAIESHSGDLYERATTNPPGTRDSAVVNSAAWRAAEVPAINGHGTARGIAGLYAALLRGELLSPALLREAVSVQC